MAPALYRELAAAWSAVLPTPARQDEVLATALLQHLDGVDQAELRTAEEPAGRPLLRALELAADPRFRPVDPGLAAIVDHARIDLAELATRAGDPDRAFRWLAEAVAQAPSPPITADTIVARPVAPLHADPRWSAFASAGLQDRPAQP